MFINDGGICQALNKTLKQVAVTIQPTFKRREPLDEKKHQHLATAMTSMDAIVSHVLQGPCIYALVRE